MTIDIDAGTTIEKLADRINGSTGLIGLRADYDETTGVFRIESTSFGASTIKVVASDMTVGPATVGLFDSDTSDPLVNTHTSLSNNRTVDVTYTDRLGIQTITLTQDPESEGGLRFTDGAFTLTMKDRSNGTIGSTSQVSTIAYTATRTNDDRAMIGTKQVSMH